MKKIHLILFFLFFILISVIEGVHFILDLRFLLYGVYCIPFFLFIFDREKTYRLPGQFILLAGVYLLSSLISVFFSREMGTSWELFLRDVSFFLILVYTHAHVEDIEEHMAPIITGLSLFFIFISFVLLLTPGGRYFIQGQRLNLLFNPAYLHKTIGDYLPLAIIISAYFLFVKKNAWYKYPLTIITPIFLLSFSRTGYIVLAFVLLLFFLIHRKTFKRIPQILKVSLAFNIFLIIILFLTLASKTENSILSYAQVNLQNILHINVRPLLTSHMPFWLMGIKGYLLSPFTGVGAGTFQYLSYRYMDTVFLTSTTSFNLLIDLLAEQGLVPTLSFVFIILYIFLKSKKTSLYFLLFLVLIIGFMGYSIYQYTQILLLFYIIGGLLIPSEKTDGVLSKKVVVGFSLVGVLFLNSLFAHSILMRMGKMEIAHTLYPFDKESGKTLIRQSLIVPMNNKKTDFYLSQYEKFNGMNAFELEYVGDMYAKMGGKYNLKAIQAYEESFTWGKYAYGNNTVSRMAKLFELKKHVQGKKQALRFVKNYMAEYKSILARDPKVLQQKIYDELYKAYLTE